MGDPANLEIGYDDISFTKENFTDIQHLLPEEIDFSIARVKQKAFEDNPYLLLIITSPAIFFAKGFFTKMGEQIGEKVGDDIGKLYEKFKDHLVEKYNKKGSKDVTLVEFKIREIDIPEISFFIRTDKKSVLRKTMDDLNNYYIDIMDYIREKQLENIKQIRIKINENGKKIDGFYYITNQYEVYVSEKVESSN